MAFSRAVRFGVEKQKLIQLEGFISIDKEELNIGLNR